MTTLFDTAPYVVHKPPEERVPNPAVNKKQRKRMHNILYKARKKGVHIRTKERIIYYDVNNPDEIKITQVDKLTAEFQFSCQAEIR